MHGDFQLRCPSDEVERKGTGVWPTRALEDPPGHKGGHVRMWDVQGKMTTGGPQQPGACMEQATLITIRAWTGLLKMAPKYDASGMRDQWIFSIHLLIRDMLGYGNGLLDCL